MVEATDLLHQKLLELRQVGQCRSNFFSVGHCGKKLLINFRVVLLSYSSQLVVHLILKLSQKSFSQLSHPPPQPHHPSSKLSSSREPTLRDRTQYIMTSNDELFQVNPEVPFRPIRHIAIQQLHLSDTVIHIRAKMTLIDDPNAEFLDLERTEADLAWLIEKLNNCEHCPLLPRTDCSDPISNLLGLLTTPQPVKIKKLHHLKQKVIERCLSLLSSVVLQHLKTVGQQYELPLFIFFHKNFSLYQNPIYYKHDSPSLSSKVGSYFWQKYAQFTSKGNTWQQLQSAKALIQEEQQRLRSASDRLQDYITQLTKLQEQFISEKDKIRKRLSTTQELHLNFEMQIRYLDIIIEQARQTATRAEQQRHQSEPLVVSYTQRLRQEAQEAGKAGKKLLGDYVKVICQEEQKLRIGPL